MAYEWEPEAAGHKARCSECETTFQVGSTPPAMATTHYAVLVAALVVVAAFALWWFAGTSDPSPAVADAIPAATAPAVSAVLASTTEPAPADGVLHQWNFDEVRDWHDSPFGALTVTPTRVADVAGGWDATPHGFAAADWASGREYMALRFPGAEAHLELGRDLGPALGGTATLAFWLRTAQGGGQTVHESPGVLGSVPGVAWAWLDHHGQLNLSVDRVPLVRTVQPVNDDRWHCVVFTRDAGSGQAQLFVDGARVHTAAGPAGLIPMTCRGVGRLEGAARAFAGRLDKITLFNRVLTGDEVSAFVSNHAPKTWAVRTAGRAGRPFVTGSPLARAYDVEGDPVTVRRWTAPAHGTVAPLDDGSFTYTPAAGFTGADRFAVVVQDGRGGFRMSAIEVEVVPDGPGDGLPVAQYVGLQPCAADGRELDHAGLSVPALADWTGDQLPDLLVGAGGRVLLHRNLGSRAAPRFAAGEPVRAGAAAIHTGDGPCPIAVFDWDGDGRVDLLYSDRERRLLWCRREADGALAAAVAVATLPDRRFDVGDWDGDRVPDVVTGTGAGAVRLFRGRRDGGAVSLDAGATLFDGSYNLYPRFADLDGNGRSDLVRGINWGGVHYWLDVGPRGLDRGGEFVFSGPGDQPDNLRATDGAVAALADLDGDGINDIVLGRHAGRGLLWARGRKLGVRDHLRVIEAIYDAHLDRPGEALAADNGALLQRLIGANRAIAGLIEQGGPQVREEVFHAVASHIRKYPFLKVQAWELPRYRHIPGTVLQNIVFLRQARPDTRRHREEVADVVGLAGVYRDVFVERGLALGDRGKLNDAQLGTVRDFQRHHPRELFPDDVITFDQLFGEGRGSLVWTPDSAKNTFGCDVGNASEWAGDLVKAIENELGKGGSHGDYFTFVMGHEVTHSLDGYVRSRANRDLARRWGRQLCRAAGPDVVPGAGGWPDWEATKVRFKDRGLFHPATEKWEDAWERYWKSGSGAAFRSRAWMRGDIDWFLASPQESLATQANHHWANGLGRLIGAYARWQEAERTGIAPMKANMTEVVDFIDYLSAGLNRVALPRPYTYREGGKRVEWTIHMAELERDDLGRITRIEVAGRIYRFSVDQEGGIAEVAVSSSGAKGGLLSPGGDAQDAGNRPAHGARP